MNKYVKYFIVGIILLAVLPIATKLFAFSIAMAFKIGFILLLGFIGVKIWDKFSNKGYNPTNKKD